MNSQIESHGSDDHRVDVSEEEADKKSNHKKSNACLTEGYDWSRWVPYVPLSNTLFQESPNTTNTLRFHAGTTLDYNDPFVSRLRQISATHTQRKAKYGVCRRPPAYGYVNFIFSATFIPCLSSDPPWNHKGLPAHM